MNSASNLIRYSYKLDRNRLPLSATATAPNVSTAMQGRRLDRESARSMRKLSSSSPSSNKSASVSLANKLVSNIMMKQWMSTIWFTELRNLTIETSALDSTLIKAIVIMLSSEVLLSSGSCQLM